MGDGKAPAALTRGIACKSCRLSERGPSRHEPVANRVDAYPNCCIGKAGRTAPAPRAGPRRSGRTPPGVVRRPRMVRDRPPRLRVARAASPVPLRGSERARSDRGRRESALPGGSSGGHFPARLPPATNLFTRVLRPPLDRSSAPVSVPLRALVVTNAASRPADDCRRRLYVRGRMARGTRTPVTSYRVGTRIPSDATCRPRGRGER